MDKELRRKAKERREQYEKEVREASDKCNLIIEQARQEFLDKRRQARHDRDIAISAMSDIHDKAKFES